MAWLDGRLQCHIVLSVCLSVSAEFILPLANCFSGPVLFLVVSWLEEVEVAPCPGQPVRAVSSQRRVVSVLSPRRLVSTGEIICTTLLVEDSSKCGAGSSGRNAESTR